MDIKLSGNNITKSLIYKFIEKISTKLIGLIVGVLLARLVAPEIFGTVAILTAIISIMQTFVDGGLNVALVQNKTTDENDYSTVFYMTFSVSLIIYIILFFFTPKILAFFNIGGYKVELRTFLIVILFYSYNSIQSAQLVREMKFNTLFICQITSSSISGIISVFAAFHDFGIWALILHYVSNSIFLCLIMNVYTKWYPKFFFSVERAKIFWNYGIKILASNLIANVFDQIRTFAVGKLYSAKDLAYYSRGDQIPYIISNSLTDVFQSVMLPVYANRQDEKESLLNIMRKTIRLNSFMTFPCMFGLSAVASSMVIIIYTEKWIECVPMMQILSLANLSISITSPCIVSIKAIGRSDSILKLEVVRRFAMLIILAISICFKSLIAIAIGWLLCSLLDVVIVSCVVRKLLGYKLTMLIHDVMPNMIISIIMYFIVYYIGTINIQIGLVFLIQVMLGILVYLTLAKLSRNPNMVEFKNLLANLIKNSN